MNKEEHFLFDERNLELCLKVLAYLNSSVAGYSLGVLEGAVGSSFFRTWKQSNVRQLLHSAWQE